MKVLVSVNSGSYSAWIKELKKEEYPRNPLVYLFKKSLLDLGHEVDIVLPNCVSQGKSFLKYKISNVHQLIQTLIRARKYDLIVSFGFIGILNSWILKYIMMSQVKSIVVVYELEKLGEGFVNIINKFKRNIAKSCTCLLASNSVQEKKWGDAIGGKTKVLSIVSGVDTDFWNRKNIDLNNKWRTNEYHDYVLIVGEEERDDLEIIKELDRRGVVVIRVTRSGVVADKYRMNIVSFGFHHVHVLHGVPYQELRSLYVNAKAVLIPTNNWTQPAGWTSMSESLACGTPVVIKQGIVEEELKVRLFSVVGHKLYSKFIIGYSSSKEAIKSIVQIVENEILYDEQEIEKVVNATIDKISMSKAREELLVVLSEIG